MRIVLIASLTLIVGASLAAQNPDYILDITDSSGSVGEQVTVATTLDAITGAQIILAYEWGVCDDSLVEVINVETGADVIYLDLK